MSQLKTNSITNIGNTGDANIELYADGSTSIRNLQNLSNNLIINGAMEVAQRGATATSGGYATADRMDVQMSQGSFQQRHEALATTELPFTEDGHRHFLRMVNTTGSTAASAFRSPSTILEAQDIASSGWNYKSATSFITLSFWVRASVSQEFYASLKTFDTSERNYVFAFTPAANVWTKVVKSIPGNSDLVFDTNNDAGLKISISAFWGTSWTDSSVVTDSWQAFTSATRFPDFATTWASANGATFDITGIQLEVGSRSTSFRHESYSETLTKCQRYFIQYNNTNPAGTELRFVTGGYGDGNSRMRFSKELPTTMRANPTATFAGAWQGQSSGSGFVDVTVNGSTCTPSTLHFYIGRNDVGKTGCVLMKDASSICALNAEL